MLGKTVGPREHPEPEGGYRDFKIGDLFIVKSPKKKFNANEVSFGGRYPYVARGSSNNGIRGFVDLEPEFLNEANSLSFGQDTATVFYQKDPYFTGDKIKVLILRNEELDALIACYLITAMRKALQRFSWGISSFDEKIIKNVTIVLPCNLAGYPDFKFMRERMRELEEERMRELEVYMKVAGFEDCSLSQSEKNALSLFNQNKVEMGLFQILDLYEKVQLKNKDFDKRKDTSSLPNEIFSVPLVNAKHGNNGIMFYGKKGIFPTEEMTIDIVQNGAVATGDVYAQPQKTGVLWDAYLIKATKHQDTENTLLFMACTIQKTIKMRFNYDEKAVWDRIKRQSVFLPVKESGDVDFELAETYIRAVKKECIARLKKEISREKKVYHAVINE